MSCSVNVWGGVQEHSSEVNEYYTVFTFLICPINNLCVPFYRHQWVGLMGLSLIILSPLNCDPEPPIGHLLFVRPRVEWKCNSSVPGAWSRDTLIIRTKYVALSEGVPSWLAWLWTIKPAFTDDMPSWLAWLEQSNQRWLKTCRAGWPDLNDQTSVDWRCAELAGLTWTIKMEWSIHASPESIPKFKL